MTMHNPFQPVEKIKTEVFSTMPEKFRKKKFNLNFREKY